MRLTRLAINLGFAGATEPLLMLPLPRPRDLSMNSMSSLPPLPMANSGLLL